MERRKKTKCSTTTKGMPRTANKKSPKQLWNHRISCRASEKPNQNSNDDDDDVVVAILRFLSRVSSTKSLATCCLK